MKRFLLVCFIACLLLTTVGCNENLEEKMESEDNITFGSLEEMKTYLNGKWYRGEYHITTYIYEEIIFHNEEIKSCRVRSYRDKDNSYIKDENYSFEKNFKDYDDDTTPEFNYEKGQIYIGKRDSSCNINVKDGYLKIDRQVYYKATDNTNISYENFETFQNIIDFLIIAVCIFALTKVIEGLNRKKEEFALPMLGDMTGCNAKSQAELLERLHEINFPVMIWEGGLDPLATAEAALQVAQAIPGATYLMYQHLGHGGADEMPELAARDCDRFFKDVEGRIL